MQPMISIVVPVYNAERYLDTLFSSLRQQSFHDYEVVFVNDGSTDDSESKLFEYSKQDSRFRFVTRENGGEGAARNTGLELITGRYVAFFDADDFVESDMLQEMVACAEAHCANEVICAIDSYHESENRFEQNAWAVSREVIPAEVVFDPSEIEDVFRHITGYAANKIYRTDYISQNNLTFQEVRTHGDLSFSCAALAGAKRVVYIDRVFYHHRIHEGSLSSSTQGAEWDCLFEALLELKHELIRLSLWDSFEKDYANYVLQMALWKFWRVSGSDRIKFDECLRSRWFAELGVTNYSKDFFYRENEYDFLKDTMAAPYRQRAGKLLEELVQQEFDQERELAFIQRELSRIEGSKQYRLGHKILRPFWLAKKTFLGGKR